VGLYNPTFMIMHRLHSFLFGVLGIAAFSACSSQYAIDGNSTIADLDGQKLYLRITKDGTSRDLCLDSCEVVHGCFNFGGAVDSVAMVELYMGDYPMMPVVLENGQLFIQMDNASQQITGGPLNERLNEFLMKRSRCENELWDINRRARNMLYEGKNLEQIVVTLDPIRNNLLTRIKNMETDFVKSNYNNVLGPGYFIRMCDNEFGFPSMNDQIYDILADAPDAFLHHPYVAHYLHMIGTTPTHFKQECLRLKEDKILNDSTLSDKQKKKAIKKLADGR